MIRTDAGRSIKLAARPLPNKLKFNMMLFAIMI